MHNLARNETTAYYATLKSKTEITDDYGNKTGQYTLTYNAPVKWSANIRWDIGAVEIEGFGLNASGERRIVTDDLNCPIDIDTVLWIGKTPDANGYAGTVKPNYVVSGVPRRSLNQIAYMVQEVNLS
jgi:hypothetical protein